MLLTLAPSPTSAFHIAWFVNRTIMATRVQGYVSLVTMPLDITRVTATETECVYLDGLMLPRIARQVACQCFIACYMRQ